MSSDKHKKQDLQKKVARLKEKIVAVDNRLDGQARAYEKLRKGFKSLRKSATPQEDVVALNRRLDEWSAEAGPQAFKALSEERAEQNREQGRRIEDLAREMQALQKGLARQVDQGTSLTARTQELEAYAADLTQARREQQERLKELGRDAGGLQEQSARLEQLTAGLAERTQTLETASEQLVRHDGAQSSQLQADERLLEELRLQAGTLADGVSELQEHYRSVEQQVSTLDADRELSSGHLDSLFTRVDALEAGAVTHGERMEDIAKQLTSLSEVLQGLLDLDADRKFADLDLRGDALAESLGEHRSRLATLEEGGKALGDRLGSAIEDAEALAGRVSAQDSNSEKLGEDLQQQAVQLSGQQHALEELTCDLAARHAQQNDDVEELEQRVRQRSLLGLLLLLLVAGLTGFLFLKPHMMQSGPVMTEHAVPRAVEPQATDEVKGLQEDIAGLNAELARLDRSVADINQSVERVDAGMEPLPAQVAALAGSVETLSSEQLEQQQQSARLLADQEQASAEIKTVARDLALLEEQLAQAAALEGLAAYGKGQRWLKAQRLGYRTIQLTGAYQRESLARFIRQHGIEADSAIHTTRYRGRKWYVLFYGTFDSLSQAKSALRELPKALTDNEPWVRRIPGSGDLLPL